jgi:uncharacterized protein (TIGR03067 family)
LVNGGAVPAADGESRPAAEKKTDDELIQGTWTVVSRELVGKKTPEAELKVLKVTIKDGTITTDDGKKKEKHAYKLDPSQKPKAINLAGTGIYSKETTFAIYELDGETLKLCWSVPSVNASSLAEPTRQVRGPPTPGDRLEHALGVRPLGIEPDGRFFAYSPPQFSHTLACPPPRRRRQPRPSATVSRRPVVTEGTSTVGSFCSSRLFTG